MWCLGETEVWLIPDGLLYSGGDKEDCLWEDLDIHYTGLTWDPFWEFWAPRANWSLGAGDVTQPEWAIYLLIHYINCISQAMGGGLFVTVMVNIKLSYIERFLTTKERNNQPSELTRCRLSTSWRFLVIFKIKSLLLPIILLESSINQLSNHISTVLHKIFWKRHSSSHK